MVSRHNLSQEIKAKAIELGFDDCGIARAEYYPELDEHLSQWIEMGYAGRMEYMHRTLSQRINVKNYFPEAKSVIVMVASYLVDNTVWMSDYKVAKFAQVSDYHHVLKIRLQELINFIQHKKPGSENILSVDAQPVAERFWAVKAGLGFLGQNSMFIHPTYGSHVFICTVITNVELEADLSENRSCMGCGNCLEACPNGAIVKPFTIDVRRCISYLTIEYRDNFEDNETLQLCSNLFGCDICNDVCPHNKGVKTLTNKLFQPRAISQYRNEDWEQMGSAQFKRELSSTPLRRAGLKLLRRNIRKINTEKY